ncbi:MAG TPA: MBL fold metallo-hydrolase [Candidatus Bathyarchaeia archaeon]|nr:MBL fold metallo-hydrolase [Candidatus Bathyarchaeia archaeon]
MQVARSVSVTTLADNVVYHSGLLGQFGFSAYLEIKDYRGQRHSVVFDTGRIRSALLYNIKALKLDLSQLECIILSHGHHDHTCATVEMIRRSKRRVKVVVHPSIFYPRFAVEKGRRRYHGIPKGELKEDMLKAGAEIVETTRPIEIIPGVLTSGEIERVTPFEKVTWKNFAIIEGKQVKDKVPEDQALFINIEKRGVLVISGCAHAGIINTLQCASDVTRTKLYGFIGGTHLIRPKETRLKETLKGLREFNLKLVSPAHCTGHKSIAAINQAFPEAFILNYAGRTIDTAKKLKDPVF